MLKVLIFGGRLDGDAFMKKISDELPLINTIRIIEHKNIKNPHEARKSAEQAILPYIDKVDLIIFADYLLSNTTSLKYFSRKYRHQKFVGFALKPRRIVRKTSTLIFTTKAVARRLTFFIYAHQVKAKTVCIDKWPLFANEGLLNGEKIIKILREKVKISSGGAPSQILLACSHFNELKTELRKVFGHNVRVVDCFDDTLWNVCKALEIRGGIGKKIK